MYIRINCYQTKNLPLMPHNLHSFHVLDRKKFTDKENQLILSKLRKEINSLDPSISSGDIRGKTIRKG